MVASLEAELERMMAADGDQDQEMAVDGVETNCLEALGGTCDADYECSYVAPAPADDASTAPSQQSGATVASLAASTLAALAAANL